MFNGTEFQFENVRNLEVDGKGWLQKNVNILNATH